MNENTPVKRLKITAAVLYTILLSIYLTIGFLSLWMLYVVSFPERDSGVLKSDVTNSYIMFGVLLIVCLICSISGIGKLFSDKKYSWWILPTYLFLPISIPYIIIKEKIKDNYQIFEVNDVKIYKLLFILSSIINYLLAMSSLIFIVSLIIASVLEPTVLYFAIPVTFIYSLMIIGTTAHIINYFYPSKIANITSYLGFTFVWIFKLYKVSLKQHHLYQMNVI